MWLERGRATLCPLPDLQIAVGTFWVSTQPLPLLGSLKASKWHASNEMARINKEGRRITSESTPFIFVHPLLFGKDSLSPQTTRLDYQCTCR